MTDPLHLTFLLPVLFMTVLFQIADITGYAEPRYDFLSFAFTLAYLVSFALSAKDGRRGGDAGISED